MKKLLIILGTIFLIIIVLCGVCLTIIAVKGSALDKQSKAYAETNLPLIVSSWDEQALLDRAGPGFMKATSRGELDKYFGIMSRKLGNMHAYEGCSGESDMHFSILSHHNGEVIRAKYTARMVFDHGSAIITLMLIKHENKWEIDDFSIDSDALLAQ